MDCHLPSHENFNISLLLSVELSVVLNFEYVILDSKHMPNSLCEKFLCTEPCVRCIFIHIGSA